MRKFYKELIRDTKILKDAFLSISIFNRLLFLSAIVFLVILIPFTINNSQNYKQEAVTTATPTPTPAQSEKVYGSAINADTLANTQVGGTSCGCSNLISSYRFRATVSSTLSSIKIYLIGPGHPGYSAGTGGKIEVSVQTDNGGKPSGTVLTSTEITPRDNAGFTISFPSPAFLTSGQVYHIVFRNTDPSPTVNYSSINSLYVYGSTLTPVQPKFDDMDWAQLMNAGSGWEVRPNFTPILNLFYGNGETAGAGYMEVWVYTYQKISGVNQVRESFTVSGSDKTVSSVAVRLRRTSGNSPLTLRLETSAGTLIEEVSVPASSIAASASGGDNGGAVWASANFSSLHTLALGQSYNLVLSTASDAEYTIFALRKGVDYGYTSKTYFNDGIAQFTTGSGWTYFGYSGAPNLGQSDIQFYFGLSQQTVSTPTPSPTSSPTPIPTSTPTLTPTPLPTATPTPLPTSTPTPAPPTPTPVVLNQGDGLLGMYYSNRFLNGIPLYRIDPTINFDWVKGSPMSGIQSNNFSVRWSGYIVPKNTETYTFYAKTDDGVRVWVNGILVINSWFDHSASTEYSGRISLLASQKYSIKVEYYEKNVYSSARVSWSSPSTPKGIIPMSQLYTYY